MLIIHLFLCHEPYNICDELLPTLVNISFHILVLSLTDEADDILICR